MARTFLKVYVELGSYFASVSTNKRHHHHHHQLANLFSALYRSRYFGALCPEQSVHCACSTLEPLRLVDKLLHIQLARVRLQNGTKKS